VTNKLCMAMFCALLAPVVAAAAENSIEPGQWKVTTHTMMNGGAMPPQVKARCLTAEQAGDVGKTFGPQSGAVNSTCEPTEYDAAGRKLKWHLKCKGQFDMEVAADFNFDSPVHYNATIVTKGWMAGALTSDVRMELEGEHVGECQQ
jgi:Protein of unknown function (DUF3617)